MNRPRLLQRDERVSPFEQGVIVFACIAGALATAAFLVAVFEKYILPFLPH